jgi:hypothetical protein
VAQLNIEVPDEMRRRLVEKAKENGTTVTGLLVEYIAAYVAGKVTDKVSVLARPKDAEKVRRYVQLLETDPDSSSANSIHLNHIAAIVKNLLGHIESAEPQARKPKIVNGD